MSNVRQFCGIFCIFTIGFELILFKMMKKSFLLPVLLLIALPSFPQGEAVNKVSVEVILEKKYMNFPVCNREKRQIVRIYAGGETIREFTIHLAAGSVDWWAYLDIKPFSGKRVVVAVEGYPQNSRGLDMIFQDDTMANAEELYREELRPVYHFTAARGWHNDPNGLVFHDGIYHLYFQHNPYGWNWGNMHWGHAVSTDLVHWKQLDEALYPPALHDMRFSGSAVVDHQNTSGFGRPGRPPLITAHTSTGRGEVIGYSLNNGKTFTGYEGNPVVVHEHTGRDPKIFWYEPGGHWVMIVYDEKPDKNQQGIQIIKRTFDIHTSPDLKHWTCRSAIPGFFECPELFELPVDGNEKDTRWIVYDGMGDYLVGKFDGMVYAPESGKHDFHKGHFYASQTYNNMPGNRRVQVAWGKGMEFPGMPFNQMMLFPTELSLHTTQDGIRMFAQPVREIEKLHGRSYHREDITLTDTNSLVIYPETCALHILSTIRLDDPASCGMEVNGYRVHFDRRRWELNGHFVRPVNNRIHLEILVDRASIEIFANHGRLYIPDYHFSTGKNPCVKIYAGKGGGGTGIATVENLEIYEMRSIWLD